jgi:hypothetical protein
MGCNLRTKIYTTEPDGKKLAIWICQLLKTWFHFVKTAPFAAMSKLQVSLMNYPLAAVVIRQVAAPFAAPMYA